MGGKVEYSWVRASYRATFHSSHSTILETSKATRTVPNQETIEAMKEADIFDVLKRHDSFRELRERI